LKLLVCALETSSNIHLKALVKELNPAIELTGIFDKSLGNPTYDITQLAVMGFVDAVKKLPSLLKINNEMVSLAKDVDAVLLMDSSGFNLPLAKKIKKRYPTKTIIYYILPQAWAWKQKRIPKIEASCDILCSILPFEKEYYNKKEMIQYVGHPLLDEIKHLKTTVSNSGKVAFMPGSRRGEIQKLLPLYKEIVELIPEKAILIIPPYFTKEHIDEVYGDISMFTVSYDSHTTLEEVDFAFICSGTATLEATLIGTPFVLNYIAKSLDYFIVKNLLKIKYIGLANIFFEKMGDQPIHKEFIQNEVTVANLMNEYHTIDKEKFLKNSHKLREYLQTGSSYNVASIINKRLSKI